MGTTADASVDKEEPEDLITTTEASEEEAEDTTHLRERLQWRRWQILYGTKELTTTVALTEEHRPEESETMTKASRD